MALVIGLVLSIPFAMSRALGPARRRLQQRPRPPPGLGRVAAQRHRPDARARLPARPARPRRGCGGGSRDRARPGLRRPDHGDRRPYRPDRARRPGGLGAVRRLLAAVMVALTYLAASYYAQGAFKETAEALFVLAFATALLELDRRRAENGARASVSARRRGLWGAAFRAALPGARGRRFLLLQLCRPRLADPDPRALEPDPAGGAGGAGAADAAALPAAAADLGGAGAAGGARRRRDPGRALRLRPHLQQGRRQPTPTDRSRRSRRSAFGPLPTTASTRRAAPSWQGWPARSRCWPWSSVPPGGCGGASWRCRSASPPAPSSTSLRCPPAATTRRRRR